ncbi:hypothetical protein M407DRAFT_28250 [Tulasnella calospora MUT 4182]|uniref:Uncharacterized protein n=1 Tax=Tulasnella calospora MUT 4182 TaxID=1051891 RepID=A0A0C3LLL1_9AGAM|nr:hypothetical protein M407DRAFT_28250 [Tulasnella calospora MUT 4182]
MSQSAIPYTSDAEDWEEEITRAPAHGSKLTTATSANGMSLQPLTEANLLRPPSDLIDDASSMRTWEPPSPNPHAVYSSGPGRRSRGDGARTPVARHGFNTRNRLSANFDPLIHQDLAGLDLPAQSRPEPEVVDAKLLADLGSVEHCCEFIADVLRYALDMGLSDDKKWIADYAATRLRGSAMYWYTIELDKGSKSDWDKFQVALLKRAGRLAAGETASTKRRGSNATTSSSRTRLSRSDSVSTQNSSIFSSPDGTLYSSPASSSSYISASMIGLPGVSRTSSTSSYPRRVQSPASAQQPQFGKLLVKDYTGSTHYIGSSFNMSGICKRISERHEALYVTVDRRSRTLYLENCQSPYRTLGITWDISKDCTPHLNMGSKDRAYLVFLDQDGKPSHGWRSGPSRSAVWIVGADNHVRAFWRDENQKKHELHVLVKAESVMWYSETISLVTDPDAFLKDHHDYVRSSIVFEPQDLPSPQS